MTEENGTYHHGDLRAALLTEAAAMIADGGAESVTMRALGTRLGVSRAAPYRHFPDKSALLVAVASAGFDRLHGRLQAIEQPQPGVDLLRRIGQEYVAFALENPAHYRLMYGKEAISRETRPALQEAGNALFEQLVSVIEAQQLSGLLKQQDARDQAYVAWAAVHGLASLIIDGQILSAVDVDQLIEQSMSTLLDGMRARTE